MGITRITKKGSCMVSADLVEKNCSIPPLRSCNLLLFTIPLPLSGRCVSSKMLASVRRHTNPVVKMG